MEHKYLTPGEIAAHFRVSQDTVRRWIRAGRFPRHVNVGTAQRPTYRIPAESLESFVPKPSKVKPRVTKRYLRP